MQVVGGLPEDTPDAPDIPTVKGHELLGGPQMIQLRYVLSLVAACSAACAVHQEHVDNCHNACLSHGLTAAVCLHAGQLFCMLVIAAFYQDPGNHSKKAARHY